MESQSQESALKAQDIWWRGLFMLLLMLAFCVAQMLLSMLAVVQFLWLLFAKEPNAFLRKFGISLATWF